MMTMLMIDSPIGQLGLYADGDELVGLELPGRDPLPAREQRTPVLARAAKQLTEYFAGKRRDFDLPLAPRGTGFQERVWRALLAIPFGATCSYGDLAQTI